MPTKTPTSFASAIKPFAKRIWYQGLSGIKKVYVCGTSPDAAPQEALDASTENSSLATRFPQEIVDTIVACLTHDTRSLLACSLTSRSLYNASVKHLHRTIITKTRYFDNEEKSTWPKPLQAASKFGWLPFVTKLIIYGNGLHDSKRSFSSQQFDHRTQLEFSALTNVQELHITNFDLNSFFPAIQQYFGQFSPTVLSLTLGTVNGSDRQIAFFIGLFQRLEDLELYPDELCPWRESRDDLTLIPPFVPPLRGLLTTHGSGGYGLAKSMTNLFGGVRFRRMVLQGAGTQTLIYACANALEELWLNATEICGTSFDRDLDLSRNGSLQKLEITANSLISTLKDRAPGTVPSSFRAMVSTVKPPVFSVVVVYGGNDFYNAAYSWGAQAGLGDEGAWYNRQFEVFREMYKARDYRLVLRAIYVGDVSVRELERAVAVEKAKGGLPPELSVTYTLAGR